MGVKFTNNAETTLSSGINNSVTTISVASSSTFPSISGSNYFYATIDDDTNNEVVKVTAVSGTTWTVVRAQDNTTARAFDSGDKVELRMNVALLEDALGDAATFARDSFTGDGSTTDFTLSQTAASENNLIVFIEGVFQTQSAYSLSGTTLSFSSAPANTREIIVYSTQALSAGTVTTASIVDDNITQAKIADDAVGADQLAASAVVTASIVDDNVTQAKIADDAVGADQLASSAVVTASIVDDAVTTAKIADDQVTLAKMAGLARGKIIYGDSSGNPAALAVGSNGQILKSDGTDISWGAESTFDTDAAQVFNESGNDVDFRVESNGNANMLFVDGGNDNILIGTQDQGHMRLNQQLGFAVSGNEYGGMSFVTHSATGTGNRALLDFNRSRNTTIGSHTVVVNGDSLGTVVFRGDDGDEFLDACYIQAEVDGTPGNGDMPGRLCFFTTPDGASSSTEKMRITADGKVGIGTTSPLSHLTFESDHWNTGTEDGPSIRWNNGITTADSVLQSFEDSNVVPMILGMNAYIASGGSFASFNSSYASAYVYTGADGSVYLGNAASGNPTNKVRVHPDGNTGIGGNATNAKLEVVATSGEVFRADANNGAYRIVANQDNVMLNGTVLVGTSSAVSNAKLTVDGGDMMVQGANNSAGISDLLPGYTRGDYGVIHSTANHVYFSVGSSYVSYINGGNGTFNVSDQRLKENVATLTGTLDKVKQLRGVSFTWKDTEERGTDTAIGLIAQEVEAVYPQLVDDGGLPKDNDGNDPLKSVNYAHLTSVLIEAIKELSTELDAAKARITTLEG